VNSSFNAAWIQSDSFAAATNFGEDLYMATPETKLSSWTRVLGIALGVGVVSFLATELMHRSLVPDLGRNRERLLAEAISALIVTCLVARLAHMAGEQHRATVARMQVIAEMNHHIRNALAPITLSVDAIENQQLIRIISDGVDRIDWALREILPREKPFLKEKTYAAAFFAGPRKSRAAAKKDPRNTRQQRPDSKIFRQAQPYDRSTE
jgi:signal transduction histidine kinase